MVIESCHTSTQTRAQRVKHISRNFKSQHIRLSYHDTAPVPSPIPIHDALPQVTYMTKDKQTHRTIGASKTKLAEMQWDVGVYTEPLLFIVRASQYDNGTLLFGDWLIYAV